MCRHSESLVSAVAVAYHHGAARAVRAAIAGRPMPRLSRFRARAGREVQRDRPGHPAPGHRAQRPHARGRRGRAHLPAFRGPRPGLWLALRCPAKATMDKQCLEPEDIGRLRSSVGHRLQLRGARAETSYCCGRTNACSGFRALTLCARSRDTRLRTPVSRRLHSDRDQRIEQQATPRATAPSSSS